MSATKAIRAVASSTVTAALILLGWGFTNAASFFACVPRAALLCIAIIAVACAAVLAVNPTKKGSRTPPGQRLVLASVQIITLPLLVFAPYADRHGIFVIHAGWIRWLGLACAVAGYAIMLVALRALGKNYSMFVTIQQQHQLIQTSIYALIRHPIYSGILLAWSGVCLVFRSWLAVPVFLYFLIFGVLRGAQEERILREEFGSAFDAYRQRTWRLLPHIY